MQNFLRSLFPVPPSTDSRLTWRAINLYAGLLLFAGMRLLLLIPSVFDQTVDQIGLGDSTLAVVQLLLVGMAILAYVLVRREQFESAAYVLVGLLMVEGVLFLWGDHWETPRGWAALWLAVAVSGLLLSGRQTAIVTGLAVVTLAIGGFDDSGLSGDALALRVAVFLCAALFTLALAWITFITRRSADQTIRSIVQQDTARHLIEIGDDVALGLFSRQDLDTFLAHIAQQIEQRFESIYHVQIYLVKEGNEQATLRAATGSVGAQLLAQEYEIDVGGLSVVGRVTISGKHLMIPDFAKNPIHKPHVFLAETRSELAIPLVINEKVIGALDLQSTLVNTFDDALVAILRSITNQLAIAVDGLQLYESAQRSSRENQALYMQTQASLREIERLNYQLTGRAWADYLRLQTDTTAMTLNLENGQLVNSADWTDSLNEAATQRQVITLTQDGRRVVALPLVVRNEVVGAMEFEMETETELPDGAIEMVEAVGQRLGLAMENRRLFDETQRAAQREALINDIGADLQGATGVDAIVQRAAQHLQQSLSAKQVTIRLGTMPEDATS